MVKPDTIAIPDGYTTALLRAPLETGLARRMERLLGHKGTPWLPDILRRYRGSGPDFCAIAFHQGQAAAHVWIGQDTPCLELGLLGHVFTDPTHRGHGLANRLLKEAIVAFEQAGGRYLILGVNNPAAIRIYEKLGFAGYTPPVTNNHREMLRGAPDLEQFRKNFFAPAMAFKLERLNPGRYASSVLLLTAFPGAAKLPLLDIPDGSNAEQRLLNAMEEMGRGERSVELVVAAPNEHALALRHRQGTREELYCAPGHEAAIRRFLACI